MFDISYSFIFKFKNILNTNVYMTYLMEIDISTMEIYVTLCLVGFEFQYVIVNDLKVHREFKPEKANRDWILLFCFVK